MYSYNYGVHYDPLAGGYLNLSSAKTGYANQPDKFFYEWHLLSKEGSTLNATYLSSESTFNNNNAIYIKVATDNPLLSEVKIGNLGSFEIGRPPNGAKIRIRLIKDRITGDESLQCDSGDGNGVIDFGVISTGNFIAMPEYFGISQSWMKLSSFKIGQDFGSGFELLSDYDPNRVPSVDGGFVTRGSDSAVSGSDFRIYNVLDSSEFYTMQSPTSAAFVTVYDVLSVNGETETPVINLGSTGNTVTMSDEINPDSVTLSDGNKTYDFIINTTGSTTTFDLPLTSDDTLPNFGTDLTLTVVKGSDTFTKTVSLQAPAGHTVRKLVDPIEFNEEAYSHNMGFIPASGDHYFWLENTDFDITKNNICKPFGEPPFGYTIWHLSGAGLRKTNVVDGYENVEADTTKPVIQIAGPNPLEIEYDDTFTMPAITYSEPVELEATVSGSVGSNAGTYELTVSGAEDAAGNVADPVTLTVIRKNEVIVPDPDPEADFTSGSITIGAYNKEIEVNEAFTYPAVTAEDGDGNDVSGSLVREGQVFTTISGSYSIVWKLINNLNEVVATKQIRIDVNPLPVEPPSLPGYDPVDVEAGENKTVSPGAVVVLNGSSSNAGKSGVRYKWRQTKGSRVALKQKNQLSGATFEAPVTNLVNDLEFELTEWIGVKTFRSYITITVEDVQPYVEGIDTLLVNPNQLVEMSVKPRYFDDEVTSVAWTETTAHGVALKNDDTLTATMLVPNLADNAIISFDVQVNGQFNATVDVTVKSGTIREFKSAINYSWID